MDSWPQGELTARNPTGLPIPAYGPVGVRLWVVSATGLLFLTLFNSMLGLSILFPVLAPLSRSLGFTEIQVGAFSAIYALMGIFMSPYWGRRSQAKGRRPVLLTGILGFSATFFAFAILAGLGLAGYITGGLLFVLLLLARMLGGVFASATLPTAQAYIADVTGRDTRTSGMAILGAAFGLGVIFGPALGAALSHFSLLTPVYFSASIALLNALFVYLKLPEPKTHKLGEARFLLRIFDERIWPILAVGFAVNLSSISMEQTVAFYFQDQLHLSDVATAQTVGVALVIYGLVAVFVQGFLVRKYKWSAMTLLAAGVPISLLGFLVFIFAHTFATLTLALVLQGLGQGLALPGVLGALSLAVEESEQGAVAGINGSVSAFGRFLGPLIGTGLYELHRNLPYMISAALLLAVFFAIRSPRLRMATHTT